MLRPDTFQLWERLRGEPVLAGFALVGGSALALHLGHRASEDLDFTYVGLEEPPVASDDAATREARLPRRRLEVLVERLRAEGKQVESNDNAADVDDFLLAGLELTDYQQNYLVDGVKVSFFAPDTPLRTVLRPGVRGGVRVAGLDELFASKALVCASRSSTRDWFDLYHLMTAGGYTMRDFVGIFERAADLNRLNIALRRLCSGQPGRYDEGFASLLDNALTVPQMSAFFAAERDRYERELGGGPS